MPFGDPGPYPIPGGGTGANGPQWLKLHIFQPSYEDVTDKHIYEDGGASYLTRNDTAPIRIEIRYDGLLDSEAAVLDGHRADAFGEVYDFPFTDPRTSITYTGVHYDEGHEEDHRLIETINSRRVHLIKRPV